MEAARARLWEARRLETEWEVVELESASPGAFLQVEAVFENGRAAFGLLGERGLRAERLGERAARRVLRFLDDETRSWTPGWRTSWRCRWRSRAGRPARRPPR